jgi:arabinogalactan endo-1,4-beta-galactosidase
MDRFAVDAKNNEGVIVWVDIQKTIDILEVYKKSGQKHVRIKIWKPLDPIYFIWDNGEEFKEKIEEIEAILMPLKIK